MRGVQPKQQPEGMDPGEKVEPHDFDSILPLSLIRDHTKTNDIPAVTDEQLRLYRRAALEAAQKYTGLQLLDKRTVIEVLPAPKSMHRRRKNTYRVRVKYPFAQPIAYVYGYTRRHAYEVAVDVGSTQAEVPIVVDDVGLGCCDPCRQPITGRIMYSAGYDCLSQAPAGIQLGALKYIAHVIENAGDVVMATSETGRATQGYSLSTAANPAIASGAVEIFRMVVDDAI